VRFFLPKNDNNIEFEIYNDSALNKRERTIDIDTSKFDYKKSLHIMYEYDVTAVGKAISSCLRPVILSEIFLIFLCFKILLFIFNKANHLFFALHWASLWFYTTSLQFPIDFDI
jgi:hypothetical protein